MVFFLKKKIYVIAEVGLSHEGSFGIAKYYIELARKLGADAIKFQTYTSKYESSKI